MTDRFDSYRKWFNQLFALTVNGKFKGLYYLLNVMDVKHFEHFLAKIKKLVLNGRGRYCRCIDMIHTIHYCGLTLKLYSR